MKNKLVLIAVLATLGGCAQLDAQNAGKGQKTVEAAAGGGILGNLAGRFLGVDSRITTLVSATFAGWLEYQHATNLEITAAQKQADAMKAAGITSDVKIVKVAGKDGKTTDELKSFVVHSTSDDAVVAVGQTAQGSAFGGKIVIVSSRAERKHIEDQLALTVNKKNVKTMYFSPVQARKFGAKKGVAWVPVHPVIAASSARKERGQS